MLINIPYGQSSAKLPVTQLLGHSITKSLGHSIIPSFHHPIFQFNMSTIITLTCCQRQVWVIRIHSTTATVNYKILPNSHKMQKSLWSRNLGPAKCWVDWGVGDRTGCIGILDGDSYQSPAAVLQAARRDGVQNAFRCGVWNVSAAAAVYSPVSTLSLSSAFLNWCKHKECFEPWMNALCICFNNWIYCYIHLSASRPVDVVC